MSQQRQLAAILFTDIIGYTALMQENEHKAVSLIRHYNESLNLLVDKHSGKVVNNYGDGSLCTFTNVVDALSCACEIQVELQKDPAVPLRIGLHVGEVFYEDGKVLGDGVNLASRIQSLGQANTILFSKEVFDKIRNHPEFKAKSLGQFHFKHVHEPVEVFALANEGLMVPKRGGMEGKLKKGTLTMRRWMVGALGLLVLLAAVLLWQYLKGPAFSGKEKTIAILPFKNLSAPKENEVIGESLTDELITQLYQIADLKVKSFTAVAGFKDSIPALRDIAEKLGVAALLYGTVQQRGGKMNIHAHLFDANTNLTIWSKSYQYDIQTADNFDIQTEISQSIASQLNANFTAEEKKTTSPRNLQKILRHTAYTQ